MPPESLSLECRHAVTVRAPRRLRLTGTEFRADGGGPAASVTARCQARGARTQTGGARCPAARHLTATTASMTAVRQQPLPST